MMFSGVDNRKLPESSSRGAPGASVPVDQSPPLCPASPGSAPCCAFLPLFAALNAARCTVPAGKQGRSYVRANCSL